jgi:hypothetical protein
MLEIKPKFHLSLPSLSLRQPKTLQLSPVVDDDDELTTAVQADPIDHDDNWQLTDRPDEAELDQFWTKVEDDVKKDPSWFTFDNE